MNAKGLGQDNLCLPVVTASNLSPEVLYDPAGQKQSQQSQMQHCKVPLLLQQISYLAFTFRPNGFPDRLHAASHPCDCFEAADANLEAEHIWPVPQSQSFHELSMWPLVPLI